MEDPKNYILKTKMFKCPKCNTEISDKQIAQYLGAIGGKKAAKGMTKQQRIDRATKASHSRKKQVLDNS